MFEDSNVEDVAQTEIDFSEAMAEVEDLPSKEDAQLGELCRDEPRSLTTPITDEEEAELVEAFTGGEGE